MTYIPKAGDTLRIVIPQPNDDAELAEKGATAAARHHCEEAGLELAEFRHVSSEPWTEPFSGVDPPGEGYWLHHFEGIAG